MTEPDDLVVQAAGLKAREEAGGGPQGIIDTLVRGVASQRRALKWVALGLILDLCLSIAVGIAYVRIARNTSAAHATCVVTNDSRANAKEIWTAVLPLAVHNTPDEKARVAQVRALVDKTYAPRDCH